MARSTCPGESLLSAHHWELARADWLTRYGRQEAAAMARRWAEHYRDRIQRELGLAVDD